MKLIVEIQDTGVYVYRETKERFAEIEKNGRGAVKVSHEVIDEECDVVKNPQLGVGTYMVFNLAEDQVACEKIKPTKEIIERYNYYKCEKHIANFLGVKSLRDFAGKHCADPKENEDVPYQDFWHEVMKNNDVHNGCYIYIGKEDRDDYPDWAKPIVDAFVKEFGDDQEYWVEW